MPLIPEVDKMINTKFVFYETDNTVEYYNLSKKEFLRTLLIINDYLYHKKDFLNFDDILMDVDRSTINKVNFNISNEEWLSDDPFDKGFYINALAKCEDKGIKNIRTALKDFDSSINPFMNSDIELKDPIEYLPNLNISATDDSRLRVDCYKRDNSALIEITDQSLNEIFYKRCAGQFTYTMHYRIDEYSVFTLVHDYLKGKETVTFRFITDNNGFKKEYFSYDLISDRIQYSSGLPRIATEEEKNVVLNKIKEATEYAKDVTLKNMARKNCKNKIKKV